MDFLLIAASPLIGFGVAFAMNSLAVRPFQRAGGAHWTERARLLFPARKAATVNAWLTAANLAVMAQWLLGASTSIWILASTGTLLGATAGNYLLSRRVWPEVSLARWIEQTLLRACLMGIKLLLILAGACFMPAHLNLTAGIMAAGILLALLALAFGFVKVLLRGTRLIRPAPNDVHEIARRETLRAGVKLNATWVHRGPAAQAYALLPMKDMLFSDALLEAMSDEELAAVCAHEAGHLSESRWVFIGRLLGVLSLYPVIFVAPVWGAGARPASRCCFWRLSWFWFYRAV